MESTIQSFLLVFVSEMGDKTQLLALVLATRFKKPWEIIAGILVATILNHAFASYAGSWIGSLVPSHILPWILGGIFILFGLWILIPDKDEEFKEKKGWGPFITTTIVFFIAEMGDKTQLATVALAAKFAAPIAVTIGSSLGLLAANILPVFLGEKLMKKIPMKYIRIFASILFIIFGAVIIFKY